MFDICFINADPERDDDGSLWLSGHIILIDHQERFLASLQTWSRKDYERQWLEAAARLLGAPARAGFFTVAFQFWWTMWREEERVLVREEFLTAERLSGVSDWTRAPYQLIEERMSDGDQEEVSEWEIDAEDVREFLLVMAERVG